MKCRVISGAEPIRVSSLTFLISTTSSDTRRCPLFISSSAASLFPMPLSPVIRTPSPYTSTSTPCTEIQGASLTLSQRMISAINADVDFSVIRSGTLFLSAVFINSSSGYKSLQKIMQGVFSEITCGYTSFFFLSERFSIYEYSTNPIIWGLVSSKCSK